MELNQLTIEQAHQGLLDKEFSAKELTQVCMDKIKKHDSDIQAFLKVTEDCALQQAEAVDKKIASGQLDMLTGIPLAIKDNILIEGVQATAGSRILEKYQATYNATVIGKLKDLGAIFLGKTNLDEFGMGSSTENSSFFSTRNPWD